MFLTLLYYYYTPIKEAEQFALEHLKFCKSLRLVGRIIVADEGINGTISGLKSSCEEYMRYMQGLDGFAGIQFKIDEVDQPSFKKLHVRYKDEIVNSGTKDFGIKASLETSGKHLSPREFMEMKDEEDVVVLDVRSKYEHNVGRFSNALTLDIDNFREFPEKIDELAKFNNKKILTYCTGGIKCEKATAFLKSKGFKDVYQLHGGIINYGKEVGGKDFDGKCYVFDNRLVVDVNSVNPKEISTCITCGKTSSRMINCANPDCNEHFVQCEACSDKLEGCCSVKCTESPTKRDYNGTGYYVRNTHPSQLENFSDVNCELKEK